MQNHQNPFPKQVLSHLVNPLQNNERSGDPHHNSCGDPTTTVVAASQVAAATSDITSSAASTDHTDGQNHGRDDDQTGQAAAPNRTVVLQNFFDALLPNDAVPELFGFLDLA